MVATSTGRKSGGRNALSLLSKVAECSPKDGKKSSSKSSCNEWRKHVSKINRQQMYTKIIDCLKKSQPNAPDSILSRLPALGKRIEETLFRMASSLEEYKNESTIKTRLAYIQQHNTSKLFKHSSTKTTRANKEGLALNEASELYTILQSWRHDLVNALDIPPWSIFTNKILVQISQQIPTTMENLSNIIGIDKNHCEEYGQSLLKEISGYLYRKQQVEGSISSISSTSTTSSSPSISSTSSSLLTRKRMGSSVDSKCKVKRKKNNESPDKEVRSTIRPSIQPNGLYPIDLTSINTTPMLSSTFIPSQISMKSTTSPSNTKDHELWQQYEEEIRKLRLLLVQAQQENFRLHTELDLAHRQLRIHTRSVNILPKEQ